jgi:prokaryotic ubiquitin-like protein Pup
MAREGGQQQKTARKTTEEEQPPESAPADVATERKDKLDDDVDAILDDIDEVLESNAEEFVRGFVQKGGQ